MKLASARGLPAALAVTAALATTFLCAPSAQAAGANWADWSGNCYGWTTWDANQVTGHTWDHAPDDCRITIIQWNSEGVPGAGSSSTYADATAPGTGASTPTWWHGQASSGGVLEDQICVQDLTTRSEVECSQVYN